MINTEMNGLVLGNYDISIQAKNVETTKQVVKQFTMTLNNPCGTEIITPTESTFTFKAFKSSTYQLKVSIDLLYLNLIIILVFIV